MLRPIVLFSALAIAGQSATPLMAKPPVSDLPSAVVQYDDLDLSHAAGAAVLYRRIRQTAERICGEADIGDLQAWTRMQACRRDAVASTNQPVATAVDRARQVAVLGSSTRIAIR